MGQTSKNYVSHKKIKYCFDTSCIGLILNAFIQMNLAYKIDILLASWLLHKRQHNSKNIVAKTKSKLYF